MTSTSSDKAAWFSQARYGMFIHWGPYSAIGRGEQVLFREHMDQNDYARRACAWNPTHFDAAKLAATAKGAGMKYAVLTTRHHDGYCLWDSKLTDYTSMHQAPKRDLVAEYVNAFRAEGMHVGLYYSLADWRIPSHWAGPKKDPEGWKKFQAYIHGQVRELLTNYGKIAVIWFDGAWPHGAEEWQSEELVRSIRKLQPDILINNRLDIEAAPGQEEQAGGSKKFGDFGTPEHHITAEKGRPWESCQVTSWRLWGYGRGEHYRSAKHLLDFLCDCASKGGNLLLNVAPDGQGELPKEVTSALLEVGEWLKVNGEAIYGSERGELTESTTYGYQILHGEYLYVVFRFWPHESEMRLMGIEAEVAEAKVLAGNIPLKATQDETAIRLSGLPIEPPGTLFPVIRLKLRKGYRILPPGKIRIWNHDPHALIDWARSRGTSVWADGKERP